MPIKNVSVSFGLVELEQTIKRCAEAEMPGFKAVSVDWTSKTEGDQRDSWQVMSGCTVKMEKIQTRATGCDKS